MANSFPRGPGAVKRRPGFPSAGLALPLRAFDGRFRAAPFVGPLAVGTLPAPMSPTPQRLVLEDVYHWEQSAPDKLYMTQPLGGGKLETFTWKQAMDQARRVASYLESLDLPPKSQVALVSKNTAWWLIADIAIWMAGHVSVPIYPTETRDTVRYVIEHSESRVVFFGKLDHPDEIRAGIPDGPTVVTMPLSEGSGDISWDEILAKHQPKAGKTERDPKELATLVYTSGSTGRSKGVMLSFEALAIAARGLVHALKMGADDRMLSYLPLSHVFERWIVETCSFKCGMELFFAESLDTFVQDLQRARPTLFVSVPRLWLKFQQGVFKKMPPEKLERFLKIPILRGIVRKKVLKGLGLDQVRFAGSGSAPVPPELLLWYRDLGLELLEGYGMSENFCYSHISRPGQVRVGYVGNAHEGVETRISDEGEILVKSPASMMGYYKEPELSADAFTEDHFLKTGDRGELDNQGRLKITGRVKELFKTSKGKYVSPAPIENRVLTHPDIEQACVGGSGHPQPYALVVLSEEARKRAADPSVRDSIGKSIQAHIDAVNKELPHHEQLSFVTILRDEWATENGFLTPTLKLKRAAIEDEYKAHEDEWYAAKSTPLWYSAA